MKESTLVWNHFFIIWQNEMVLRHVLWHVNTWYMCACVRANLCSKEHSWLLFSRQLVDSRLHIQPAGRRWHISWLSNEEALKRAMPWSTPRIFQLKFVLFNPGLLFVLNHDQFASWVKRCHTWQSMRRTSKNIDKHSLHVFSSAPLMHVRYFSGSSWL